jgi:hypothetical protein
LLADAASVEYHVSHTSTKMSLLDKLNRLGEVKKFLKLQDLNTNQKYKVLGVKKIQTKFGLATVWILDDVGNELILPNRFDFSKIDIEEYDEDIKNGLYISKGDGDYPGVTFHKG